LPDILLERADRVPYEPPLVRALEQPARVARLSQSVPAALAQREHPASPRANVGRVAAAGRDGVDTDVWASAKSAGGGHLPSLVDSERHSEDANVTISQERDHWH